MALYFISWRRVWRLVRNSLVTTTAHRDCQLLAGPIATVTKFMIARCDRAPALAQTSLLDPPPCCLVVGCAVAGFQCARPIAAACVRPIICVEDLTEHEEYLPWQVLALKYLAVPAPSSRAHPDDHTAAATAANLQRPALAHRATARSWRRRRRRRALNVHRQVLGRTVARVYSERTVGGLDVARILPDTGRLHHPHSRIPSAALITGREAAAAIAPSPTTLPRRDTEAGEPDTSDYAR